MSHPFDPGYVAEPFLTLCAEYPEVNVYPQTSSAWSGAQSFTAAGSTENWPRRSPAACCRDLRSGTAGDRGQAPGGGSRGGAPAARGARRHSREGTARRVERPLRRRRGILRRLGPRFETPARAGARHPDVQERLGFRRKFRYEKRREEWRFSDCDVALDETPIGNFVEIEGDPAAIRRAVAALALDFASAIPYSYAGLYARKRKEDPALPEDMVFTAPPR